MEYRNPGPPQVPKTSTSWRVLVVENNPEDMEALATWLRRHGHQVEVAATGDAALQAYQRSDILLLDLELPDVDGLEVCRSIRSLSDVPIIAVTGWGTELDRVLGLQAGADDYLVKPYGFRELMARMHAVMRRSRPQAHSEQVLLHGPLRIDAASREVSLQGRVVEVTRKEFDLLYLLACHPETVIPRKRIMQQVWGGSWSRRTVDTHVSSLRGKLGGSDWIVTVRGVGFRFGSG
ncbi:response regulator transcription factor [Streptomyces sp. WAC08241]|uniref:response regulator transcription factor n=1 Tax=Streptomyces sp. WAC08241 TaxID=2487421 RepID=UPI0021AF99F5|nr:response regulator transcription factor [Streptomyces sp. WAC08241]